MPAVHSWNSPSPGDGAYPIGSFPKMCQWGELNLTSQLKPSGQQIFSTVMSRSESILIRQDKKGLL